MHKFRQLRLLLLYLLTRGTRDPLRPVTFRCLVTPLDVEFTRVSSHIYMAFAGLGRWYFSYHNVDWRGLLRERWAPLTHSELVNYRRGAKLFTRVKVTTRLIWWDDKMGYFEHRMTQGETLSAIVYSRGTFYRGRERVPPRHCILGLPDAPPMARPAIVDYWDDSGAHFQRAIEAAATR